VGVQFVFFLRENPGAEPASARSGVVRGSFAIWLRKPELADASNRFGNVLRLHDKLDKRILELMVLVIARHWSAQYEWFAHEERTRTLHRFFKTRLIVDYST